MSHGSGEYSVDFANAWSRIREIDHPSTPSTEKETCSSPSEDTNLSSLDDPNYRNLSELFIRGSAYDNFFFLYFETILSFSIAIGIGLWTIWDSGFVLFF